MKSRSLLWAAAAFVGLAPAPLMAQDLTPTGARILSDPTFLPLRGQVFGDTLYSYESPRSSQYDTTGAQTAASHGHTSLLSQTFEYGLTDDLSLYLADNYTWAHTTRTTAAGSRTTLRSDGFQDPTFGLTYRAVDQRTRPFDLDFTVLYSPDVISAQNASLLDSGDVARGGDLLTLRGAIGRETRFLTLQGYVQGQRVGDQSAATGAGGTASSSSYWQTSLGLASQARLTDRLSLNAGADRTFASDYNRFNSSTGAAAIVHPGDFTQLNVSLNYHIIPNRLVGSIDYGHTFYDHTDVDYPLDPTSNVTNHRESDQVGAQLRYVFP